MTAKYPQVSRTLLSKLTDLNCLVVWMVSILARISNNSSFLFMSLEVVSRAPTGISNTVTIMFHSLVLWQGSGIFLFFPFVSFVYCGPQKSKNHLMTNSFLFLLLLLLSLLLLEDSCIISRLITSLCCYQLSHLIIYLMLLFNRFYTTCY